MKLITKLKSLYDREPARLTSYAAAVILFACAKAGIVVPGTDILTALAYTLPVLLGGEVIRAKVSPVTPTATIPVAGKSQ